MQINNPSSQPTLADNPEPAAALPQCPLCNAALVPLCNFYRCARCSYRVCAGCESVESCSLHDE
jgi:hypothetical protein